jgi:hypothetical protein
MEGSLLRTVAGLRRDANSSGRDPCENPAIPPFLPIDYITDLGNYLI